MIFQIRADMTLSQKMMVIDRAMEFVVASSDDGDLELLSEWV